MKRNFMDYVIVAAVAACCLVLLGALTIALSGERFKKVGRTINIDFPDVTGIRMHSDVRFAGAPAGEVIGIRQLSPDERSKYPNPREHAVRLTCSIRHDIPAIPADTESYIGADTLLSEKFIGLTAGMPGSGELASGVVLVGKPPFNFDTAGGKVEPLLDNANQTLTEVRKDLNDILPKIDKLAGTFQTTSESATTLIQDAKKLIDDNSQDVHARIVEVGKVMEKVKDLIGASQNTMTDADRFIGTTDKDIQARMKEISTVLKDLDVVLDNLKVVTTNSKAFTKSIGENPARLIWGTHKKTELTPEHEIIQSTKPVPATR